MLTMHPRSGCGNIRHLIFLGLLLVILACTAAHAPQPLGDDAQPPGINIVARQALFDYSTRQGLEILRQASLKIAIPDVEKSFNLPLVGEFKLQLSNIRVAQFNASSDEARFQIQMEEFTLWITQVETVITFNWHWEKLGMSGTGTGELDLRGGDIEYRFKIVKDADSGRPLLDVESAESKFTSVSLTIKSFSADWLYQAVMNLFNDQIQKAVQAGISSALHSDVPRAINDVLASLPTKLAIRGLPFTTTFEYSIFTLTYVMVKGYGEIESDAPAALLQSTQALGPASTGGPQPQDSQGHNRFDKDGRAGVTSDVGTPHVTLLPGRARPISRSRRLMSSSRLGHLQDLVKSGWQGVAGHLLQHRQQQDQEQGQAGGGESQAQQPQEQQQQVEADMRQAQTEADQSAGVDPGSSSVSQGSGSSSSQQGPVKVMVPCPFSAAPLPLSEGEIGSDGRMVSIYLHESVANCMLWGLAQSKALSISIQDGTVPRLHLTTDLLAMLIPGLPKAYPHQLLRIDVEAIGAPPKVEFKEGDGTTVTASYRTTIYVANATLDNPKIATLAANLTITGQLGWDSTIITGVSVTHVVEQSAMDVPTKQWDSTVAWFIQNYAGLYPLSFIVDNVIHTPVTSLVSLVNAAAVAKPGWFLLSGDVQAHIPL